MGGGPRDDETEHSMAEWKAAAVPDGKAPPLLPHQAGAAPIARPRANTRERDYGDDGDGDEDGGFEQHAGRVTGSSSVNGNGNGTSYGANGHDFGMSVGSGRAGHNPKKRRKVHHACLYCRRSHMTCDLERPCTRCIKRNIGHLCHDEPREPDAKKHTKSVASRPNARTVDEADEMGPSEAASSSDQPVSNRSMAPPMGFDGTRQRSNSGYRARDLLRQDDPLSLVAPDAAGGLQAGGGMSNNANANQFAGFSDAFLTAQNFQDMSIYNPNYMIGSEVTHEFNLINDILHSSLLDDSGAGPGDPQSSGLARAGQLPSSSSSSADMLSSFPAARHGGIPAGDESAPGAPAGHFSSSSTATTGDLMLPPSKDGNRRATSTTATSRAGTGADSKDKTREYYLQAADPSGNDNPEARMSRVLRAKYEAGLLKPFNYINGYARLGKYLDGHIAPSSKQKILRTINQFRPKFREKAQGLTDMQLVYVEMWFEKQLMDYDRVFASMAVPACCWRRTGEIFRGNKEMAELINVPVDQLRDGKIALHEILTEESMVRYWEEFGTIAFDPTHDTLLTACSLKNPSDASDHPIVKSCFSFTIRRDEHKLPALIVGNFLPHDPRP